MTLFDRIFRPWRHGTFRSARREHAEHYGLPWTRWLARRDARRTR